MCQVREKDSNYYRSNHSVPATWRNPSSALPPQQLNVTSLPGLSGWDATGLPLKDPHGNLLRHGFEYHAHFTHQETEAWRDCPKCPKSHLVNGKVKVEPRSVQRKHGRRKISKVDQNHALQRRDSSSSPVWSQRLVLGGFPEKAQRWMSPRSPVPSGQSLAGLCFAFTSQELFCFYRVIKPSSLILFIFCFCVLFCLSMKEHSTLLT